MRSYSGQLQSSTQAHGDLDPIGLDSAFVSSVIPMKYMNVLSFHIDCFNITDQTGQFSVEARNSLGEWTEFNFNPVIPALADVDATIQIDIPFASFEAYRLVFKPAGGTPDGECKVFITAKQS